MAANITYFVSETKLKSFTAIHANLEPTDLLPFIIQTQDIFLQEVLGTNFYNSLKNQINNNTVTTVNANLIDEYIAPYVLNGTIYQFLPWLQYKMVNKGLLGGASEAPNSIPTDLPILKYMRDNARATMEFYRERLRRELTINQALYPEFLTVSVPQNLPPGRKSDYSMGIAIPKSGSKTMNQNYGSGINNPYPNLGNYDPNTGCDGCEERFGPTNNV